MSVTLETSLGALKIELFCDVARDACENFLALCAKGDYEGTKIHRIVRKFVCQMGDPSGTGRGGECCFGGKLDVVANNGVLHDRRGMVAFAANARGQVGSQFYITFAAQPHLDGTTAVFGRVIDGWKTLDAIERCPVDDSDYPMTDIVIDSVRIHANPLAD